MTVDSCTGNAAFDYRSYTTVRSSNQTNKMSFFSLQHNFTATQSIEYACAQATTGPSLHVNDAEHLFADSYDTRSLVLLEAIFSKAKHFRSRQTAPCISAGLKAPQRSNDTCENVVVSVFVHFRWNATLVMAAHVTIILNSVPVTELFYS